MHHSNRNSRSTDVGNLTRKHFEEYYAQGIDIAAGSNLTAAGLLRRNIMHRTHHRFGINHRLVRDHFGNAEIGNFRIHIFIYQNILRLDVTVNNVVAVSMLQCIGKSHSDFQHSIQAQLMLLHILLQSNTVNIFHNYILIAAFRYNIIDIDNIRMHQTRRGFCFSAELLQQLIVPQELVAQHFHGYITVQKLVVGQKDFGHTAIANRTNNLIASVQDGLAIFIHYSFPPPA